jgi:hypothetical protein
MGLIVVVVGIGLCNYAANAHHLTDVTVMSAAVLSSEGLYVYGARMCRQSQHPSRLEAGKNTETTISACIPIEILHRCH